MGKRFDSTEGSMKISLTFFLMAGSVLGSDRTGSKEAVIRVSGEVIGDSPTKSYMMEHRNEAEVSNKLLELGFGKRPGEELYDLRKDAGQLNKVAEKREYPIHLQRCE
jgi:hypothetical protein